MPLILNQSFPLGRFHATRWKQSPFEDRFGEWPPSPWRLLRALAARWFQYARETGDDDESIRNELLSQLAVKPPVFYLPAFTWPGEPAPRQYHKTEVAWTDASKKAAAYRKPKTTLVVDNFRAVSPADQVVWVWSEVSLAPHLAILLGELLKRTLYFGRAETLCEFTVGTPPPQAIDPCELSAADKIGSPVLVATTAKKLNLASLLASSDDRLLKEPQIPPDTEWRYARVPRRPNVVNLSHQWSKLPSNLCAIQFAVGGRVFPPSSQWIRIAEQFRGSALRRLALMVSDARVSRLADLPVDDRERFSLFTGKSSDGIPVHGHRHAYFGVYPDAMGQPTRLFCFRRTPFTSDELAALMAAAEEVVTWQPKSRDWWLRIVPLPFEMSLPPAIDESLKGTKEWISVTPFVPPGERRRFRKNGRLRSGETPQRLLEKLLETQGYPSAKIEAVGVDEPVEWVAIHESQKQRTLRRRNRGRAVRMGSRFRIRFSEPVSGPICVGHSCHFGLGLFRPAVD